jgi:hypothetical protein
VPACRPRRCENFAHRPNRQGRGSFRKNVKKNIQSEQTIYAGTLHSILSAGYKEEMINNPPIIHADMIIVDEASMIDARLFSYFYQLFNPILN